MDETEGLYMAHFREVEWPHSDDFEYCHCCGGAGSWCAESDRCLLCSLWADTNEEGLCGECERVMEWLPDQWEHAHKDQSNSRDRGFGRFTEEQLEAGDRRFHERRER